MRSSTISSIIIIIIMFPSQSASYTYDVFLCDYGPDARLAFTIKLYESLTNAGVITTLDSESVNRRHSKYLTDTLSDQIRKSRTAIVVLSENYASSAFCMEQLALIYDLMKEEKISVLTVFYQVDPWVVKSQMGSYATAFQRHELGRFKHKSQEWRTALVGICNMPTVFIIQGGGEAVISVPISQITALACNELMILDLKGKCTVQESLKAVTPTPSTPYIFSPQINNGPFCSCPQCASFSQMMSQMTSNPPLYFNHLTQFMSQTTPNSPLAPPTQRIISHTSSNPPPSSHMQFSSQTTLDPTTSDAYDDNACSTLESGIHGIWFPGGIWLPGDEELWFNSTTVMELLKELKDFEKRTVGLHGKQGSGKTTLVKVTRDQVKRSKTSDAVLFATVSQDPDEWNIQSQIAECLNMTLKNAGQSGRAEEIRMKLSSMKKILIILDDVPDEFDPEKCIGITCDDKRCKFLLTTRGENLSLKIGKKVINCKTMISMGFLHKGDALRLLQQHSGTKDDNSNQSKVGKQIAFKYEWFPESIIEIGRSLKGKSDEEWEGLLSSLNSKARYQIFLNFRGRDTRTPFTDSLNLELKRNGFKTFMDDDKLMTGDSIPTKLIKAIEESRLSIVILSENYPESFWCLEELAHILECKESKNQLVWPIFYKVEPKDIEKHRTKTGHNSMAKLEEKFENDSHKLSKWKSALNQISKISGMTYTERMSQPIFIKDIVERAIEIKNYLYIRNTDIYKV